MMTFAPVFAPSTSGSKKSIAVQTDQLRADVKRYRANARELRRLGDNANTISFTLEVKGGFEAKASIVAKLRQAATELEDIARRTSAYIKRVEAVERSLLRHHSFFGSIAGPTAYRLLPNGERVYNLEGQVAFTFVEVQAGLNLTATPLPNGKMRVVVTDSSGVGATAGVGAHGAIGKQEVGGSASIGAMASATSGRVYEVDAERLLDVLRAEAAGKVDERLRELLGGAKPVATFVSGSLKGHAEVEAATFSKGGWAQVTKSVETNRKEETRSTSYIAATGFDISVAGAGPSGEKVGKLEVVRNLQGDIIGLKTTSNTAIQVSGSKVVGASKPGQPSGGGGSQSNGSKPSKTSGGVGVTGNRETIREIDLKGPNSNIAMQAIIERLAKDPVKNASKLHELAVKHGTIERKESMTVQASVDFSAGVAAGAKAEVDLSGSVAQEVILSHSKTLGK